MLYPIQIFWEYFTLSYHIDINSLGMWKYEAGLVHLKDIGPEKCVCGHMSCVGRELLFWPRASWSTTHEIFPLKIFQHKLVVV